MNRENHYAYLLSGVNPSFSMQHQMFGSNYLAATLGFKPDNIRKVSCYEKALESVPSDFQDFVMTTGSDGLLLLYYNGDAETGNMTTHRGSIPYSDILRPLSMYRGAKIFINESCFAESAEQPMKELDLLPDRALLIASCRKDEQTKGNGFHDSMLRSWLSGAEFEPSMITEGDRTYMPVKKGRYDFERLLVKG